ncbi:purple acid phosphatase 22 [Cryptomeria japonica]|uniref:purple acid phosphatase 22 n=1 Tax=Cryptomeria japonica TaxID=3369 RepID=UPI0025ACC439|nr:purple acid phosphatase 22 [Cryptomeria japonica]
MGILNLFCFCLLVMAANASVADKNPQQVHISLVGSDHVRVSWITKDRNLPSVVEYGTSSTGEYTSSAIGESTSYKYFCYQSGAIHHVVIGPLNPNTLYYYRCGGYGPQYNLKTPPSKFPLVFAIVGDLGRTKHTKQTLERIKEMKHDVFILPGDLSYADRLQNVWDSFGKMVEPLASTRPWMVTQGNHEVEIIPILMKHPFRAYNARWRMPYEQSGSISNLFYSFEVTGVHVLMLGYYTKFVKDSEQYNWLQEDIKRIDRVRTPWVIAVMHVPWYSTNKAHEGEGEKMRKALEELLYAARVDMVFAGHVHAYERFSRVYDNKSDACGSIHFTVGGGGTSEGLALKFKEPKSELSEYREATYGHGELHIYNATHAHWSWHRNADESSVEVDPVWIQSLSTSTRCATTHFQPLKESVNNIFLNGQCNAL